VTAWLLLILAQVHCKLAPQTKVCGLLGDNREL
jgi:hypothetical protein